MIAGTKDNKNTFTGVMMGTIKGANNFAQSGILGF
jgi:hypothetical protein